MKKKLASFASYQVQSEQIEISDEMLSKVNSLKKNGPNKKLTSDDIYIRSILIIGEEATSKLSIHPERELNGKSLNILTQISKLAIGSAMLEGHDFSKIPWGRVFHSEVLDGLEGYDGKVVKLYYYFPKNTKGDQIAQEIDTGIRAEGSISYYFSTPSCSICHKKIGFGNSGDYCRSHQIGEEYEISGEKQICYWYPTKITSVLESSHVFAGAYGKTKSNYSDDLTEGFNNLEVLLTKHSIPDTALIDEVEKIKNEQTEDVSNNDEVSDTSESSTRSESDEQGSTNGLLSDGGENSGEGREGTDDNAEESGISESNSAESGGQSESGDHVESTLADEKIIKLYYCPECLTASHIQDDFVECQKCNTLNTSIEYSDKFEESYILSVLSEKTFQLKPSKTEVENNEYFTKESFSELPDGEYSVEPNYNGVFISASKFGDNVKMLSLEGKDYSLKLSKIVEQLESYDKDFRLIGEILIYVEGKRLSYDAIDSYLESYDSLDDVKVFFKSCDLISFDGENLSEKPASERYDIQTRNFKNSKNVQCVARVIVSHKKGESLLVGAICKNSTSEGAVIKNLKHKYSKLDSNMLYKLNSQKLIDCLVESVETKDKVNTCLCSVGLGDNKQEVGKVCLGNTEVKEGDILKVSVDCVRNDGKYTLYSPEVLGVYSDIIKPDPVSTLFNISKANISVNFFVLNDVIASLKELSLSSPVSLTGEIVEKCYSESNIHIVCNSEEDQKLITDKLGKDIVCFVESDSEVQIKVEFLQEKFPFKDKYVLQEHKMGSQVHYDLRFGHDKQDKFWGYTIFKPLPKDSTKTRSQEKASGNIKWMSIDEELPPNSPGNPTAQKGSMKIIDSGKFEIVRKTDNFVEFKLDGKNSGRYYVSTVNTKADSFKGGEDDKPLNDKLSLIWKAKEQEKNSAEVYNEGFPEVKYSSFDGVQGFYIDD